MSIESIDGKIGGYACVGVDRISVPAYERAKQLYAFGLNVTQITETLKQEFEDIEYNPISQHVVKNMLKEHRSDFELARLELSTYCKEDLQRHTALLFDAVQKDEFNLVAVLSKRLRDVTEQLADLDIDEKDDDGNYKNTSRFFVLFEMADKLQTKMAKITGTDALREVEIFRQKALIKAESEQAKGALLPAHGRTVEVEGDSPKFI